MAKKDNKQKTKPKVDSGVKTFYVFASIIVLAIVYMFIRMAIPKDVAKIGKRVIDGYEFNYYLTQYVQEALKNKSPYEDVNSYLYKDSGYGSLMDTLKNQALSEAAQVEMLLLKADEERFKVDRKTLNEEWKTFRDSLKEEAQRKGVSLSEYVKTYYGVSMRKAERIYKEIVTARKYMDAKVPEIPATEEELTSYYEYNREMFDKAVVRHILIKCAEDADDETVAEKQKQAQDLLNRVNAGEDIATLAQEYSEDEGSKDYGGMYEVMYGQFIQEFEDWTFSHQPGDTGLIRTYYGFHVMKLDSIDNTFEANREIVEQYYKASKFQDMINEALGSGQYDVQILEGFDSAY